LGRKRGWSAIWIETQTGCCWDGVNALNPSREVWSIDRVNNRTECWQPKPKQVRLDNPGLCTANVLKHRKYNEGFLHWSIKKKISIFLSNFKQIGRNDVRLNYINVATVTVQLHNLLWPFTCSLTGLWSLIKSLFRLQPSRHTLPDSQTLVLGPISCCRPRLSLFNPLARLPVNPAAFCLIVTLPAVSEALHKSPKIPGGVWLHVGPGNDPCQPLNVCCTPETSLTRNCKISTYGIKRIRECC